MPEEQGITDQALCDAHCRVDQPQPGQCSKSADLITIPKKDKSSNEQAQEKGEQVQAKYAAKKQDSERTK